ncbi:MAG: class I SAM-dependent methyltransferase [Bacteroidota bacterium]|nr:class I SAM-dependent methyltransferase [Bacteroidota bacterium]
MARYNEANRQKHERRGWIARWHLQNVLEVIYKLVAQTDPAMVLDAGCGEGFVADYLNRRNPELSITGIDHSAEAVAYARSRFGHAADFKIGSVLELPYADRSFDTVVCSEVLEHIPEHEVAMGELKRVARNAVVISVPNEPYFKWLNDIARAIRFSQDPGHVNFWTHRQFRRYMRSHFAHPQFSRKHIMYQFAVASLRPDESWRGQLAYS